QMSCLPQKPAARLPSRWRESRTSYEAPSSLGGGRHNPTTCESGDWKPKWSVGIARKRLSARWDYNPRASRLGHASEFLESCLVGAALLPGRRGACVRAWGPDG